jgi:hypothetical protein
VSARAPPARAAPVRARESVLRACMRVGTHTHMCVCVRVCCMSGGAHACVCVCVRVCACACVCVCCREAGAVRGNTHARMHACMRCRCLRCLLPPPPSPAVCLLLSRAQRGAVLHAGRAHDLLRGALCVMSCALCWCASCWRVWRWCVWHTCSAASPCAPRLAHTHTHLPFPPPQNTHSHAHTMPRTIERARARARPPTPSTGPAGWRQRL